ncbi:MAG: aspartate kinase [Gemmatimonadales bacterium]
MPAAPRRPGIHKFGGASLADAAAIRGAVKIILSRPSPRVIVLSALAGVTEQLLGVLAKATAGDEAGALADVAAFRANHRAVVSGLLPTADRRLLREAIDATSAELEALARSLAVLREASPRVRDHVVARGERLSARLVAAALEAAGEKVALVEPSDVIVTDGPYGGGTPNLDATRTAARKTLLPLLKRGATVVVPGFLGRAPDGGTTTLGRGGSDLTATMLGRALDAESVTLWKDVPGLLTADPRVVPDARLLPHVHLREAAELAYYGAKVLHPRALLPLADTNIPLFLRPFADPSAAGTEISSRRDSNRSPVRSLSAVREQALVTVSGTGILGVPGMAARTFGALQAAGISVSLIAQASSEYTIDFTVPADAAKQAVTVLRHAFRAEIAQGELDGVQLRGRIAIIAVVGLGMAGHPGIAARVFDSLADGGVNVVAIAQGSGEQNISVVVDESQVSEGLRRIHAAFQLGKLGGGQSHRRTGCDVILLGAGTVGRAVLRLLTRAPERFTTVRIVAVVDRSGALIDGAGMATRTLKMIEAAKGEHQAIASMPGATKGAPHEIIAQLTQRALVRPIIIDCTADDTAALLTVAAEAGWDIVLANKKPIAGPWAKTARLRAALAQGGGRLRHEATVGAGTPIILAVEQLIATGDKIRSLEGSLSGTLGVVLSGLDAGEPFSEVVYRAQREGYTEPDPRDDLGGIDVGRKAIILARMLGQTLDVGDIAIDSLVRGGARLSREAWLAALPKDDSWWRARADAARAKDRSLRFVARVTPRAVSVQLREMPRSHPLAQLVGSANQLVISSDRYHESPLVITGHGAGPEGTATGVLADLLTLASI